MNTIQATLIICTILLPVIIWLAVSYGFDKGVKRSCLNRYAEGYFKGIENKRRDGIKQYSEGFKAGQASVARKRDAKGKFVGRGL